MASWHVMSRILLCFYFIFYIILSFIWVFPPTSDRCGCVKINWYAYAREMLFQSTYYLLEIEICQIWSDNFLWWENTNSCEYVNYCVDTIQCDCRITFANDNILDNKLIEFSNVPTDFNDNYSVKESMDEWSWNCFIY